MQNHLRDKERIDTRRFIAGEVAFHFCIEGLNASDTRSPNNTRAVFVQLFKVEACILNCFISRGKGKMRKAVKLTHFLFIQKVGRIEAFHLTGKTRFKLRRIKLRDKCSSAFAGNQSSPKV